MQNLNDLYRYGFNQTAQNYTKSQKVNVVELCYCYIATNVGDSPVIVNGQRLFPSATPATEVGDSVTISDPAGVVYKGDLIVSFPIATLGAAPNVEIVQLFYLTDQAIKNV